MFRDQVGFELEYLTPQTDAFDGSTPLPGISFCSKAKVWGLFQHVSYLSERCYVRKYRIQNICCSVYIVLLYSSFFQTKLLHP